MNKGLPPHKLGVQNYPFILFLEPREQPYSISSETFHPQNNVFINKCAIVSGFICNFATSCYGLNVFEVSQHKDE